MFPSSHRARSHWLAFALALAWLPSTGALAAVDRDEQEINAYRLTDAALAKYAQAMRNFAEAGAQAPGACEEEEDDENVTTIDEAVAELRKQPAAMKALSSAGLSPREFVVFTFSLLQAGMAAWAVDEAGGAIPPGVPVANVNFYRRHKSELQRMGEESSPDGCGDEYPDEVTIEDGADE